MVGKVISSFIWCYAFSHISICINPICPCNSFNIRVKPKGKKKQISYDVLLNTPEYHHVPMDWLNFMWMHNHVECDMLSLDGFDHSIYYQLLFFYLQSIVNETGQYQCCMFHQEIFNCMIWIGDVFKYIWILRISEIQLG